MVGAHQNLSGSHDLTTHLSGMISHQWATTYYNQHVYQIWNICPHSLRRYERRYHITSTLWDTLHWLPITQRVTFKTALMTHDCHYGRCLKYRYLCAVCTPVHTVSARSRLRSADHGDLVIPHWLLALAAAASALSDPQLGTVFPQTFVVWAPRSSSNGAGCLSACTAGGGSEILLYEDVPYKFPLYYYHYYYYYYYYYQMLKIG